MSSFLSEPDRREVAAYLKAIRTDPCSYCGDLAGWRDLPLDHIVPKRWGGVDDWSNLTAACSECNTGKSSGSLLGYLLHTSQRRWRFIIQQELDQLMRWKVIGR